MLTFDRTIENWVNRSNINHTLTLLGRALMAYIFIVAGWNKIAGYAGTAAYMEAKGIPSELLSLVILLELGGGLAVLIGYQTRMIALFLALFCIASAFIFHGAPDDSIGLMKNLAMAGGFFYILVQGAGKFSVDHLLTRK